VATFSVSSAAAGDAAETRMATAAKAPRAMFHSPYCRLLASCSAVRKIFSRRWSVEQVSIFRHHDHFLVRLPGDARSTEGVPAMECAVFLVRMDYSVARFFHLNHAGTC
jgi:hypothetical protein